jgi:hypothetical protein
MAIECSSGKVTLAKWSDLCQLADILDSWRPPAWPLTTTEDPSPTYGPLKDTYALFKQSEFTTREIKYTWVFIDGVWDPCAESCIADHYAEVPTALSESEQYALDLGRLYFIGAEPGTSTTANAPCFCCLTAKVAQDGDALVFQSTDLPVACVTTADWSAPCLSGTGSSRAGLLNTALVQRDVTLPGPRHLVDEINGFLVYEEQLCDGSSRSVEYYYEWKTSPNRYELRKVKIPLTGYFGWNIAAADFHALFTRAVAQCNASPGAKKDSVLRNGEYLLEYYRVQVGDLIHSITANTSPGCIQAVFNVEESDYTYTLPWDAATCSGDVDEFCNLPVYCNTIKHLEAIFNAFSLLHLTGFQTKSLRRTGERFGFNFLYPLGSGPVDPNEYLRTFLRIDCAGAAVYYGETSPGSGELYEVDRAFNQGYVQYVGPGSAVFGTTRHMEYTPDGSVDVTEPIEISESLIFRLPAAGSDELLLDAFDEAFFDNELTSPESMFGPGGGRLTARLTQETSLPRLWLETLVALDADSWPETYTSQPWYVAPTAIQIANSFTLYWQTALDVTRGRFRFPIPPGVPAGYTVSWTERFTPTVGYPQVPTGPSEETDYYYVWDGVSEYSPEFTLGSGDQEQGIWELTDLVETMDGATRPPSIGSAKKKARAYVPLSISLNKYNGLGASYSATGLPSGLSINAGTGEISGTPSAAGTYSITVTATNANGATNATLELTLIGSPQVRTLENKTFFAGSPVSFFIDTEYSAGGYTATGLPPGMSVNFLTGEVSGTPTTLGTYSVTLTAADAAGVSATVITITIAVSPARAPVIYGITTDWDSDVRNIQLGILYTEPLAADNSPEIFSLVSGSLPPGLSLNALTGLIYGTPTTDGCYTFGVAAANTIGGQGPTAVFHFRVFRVVSVEASSTAEDTATDNTFSTSEGTVGSSTYETELDPYTTIITVPSHTEIDNDTYTTFSTSEGTLESYTTEVETGSYTSEGTLESYTTETTTGSYTSEGTLESYTTEVETGSYTSEGTLESYTTETTTGSYTSEGVIPSHTEEVELPSFVTTATQLSTTYSASDYYNTTTTNTYTESSYTTEITVESYTSEDTVESYTSESTVFSNTTEITVPSATSEGTVESYTSEATVESYTSEGTVPSTTSEATAPSTTSEGTIESYTSTATVESYTSEITVGSYTFEVTVPSATSEATVPSTTFEDTVESYTSEASVESYTSEATVPSTTSEDTYESHTEVQVIGSYTSAATVPSATFEAPVESYTSEASVESYTSEDTVESYTSEAYVESYTSEATVESYTSEATVPSTTSEGTVESYTSEDSTESYTSEATVDSYTSTATVPSATSEATVPSTTSVGTVESYTSEDSTESYTSEATVDSYTSEDTVPSTTSEAPVESYTLEDSWTFTTFSTYTDSHTFEDITTFDTSFTGTQTYTYNTSSTYTATTITGYSSSDYVYASGFVYVGGYPHGTPDSWYEEDSNSFDFGSYSGTGFTTSSASDSELGYWWTNATSWSTDNRGAAITTLTDYYSTSANQDITYVASSTDYFDLTIHTAPEDVTEVYDNTYTTSGSTTETITDTYDSSASSVSTVPSTTSEAYVESYTSEATVESYTSEATVPSSSSEATVPSTTSEAPVESYTSVGTVESYTSEDSVGSYTSTATVPSSSSEATVPSTTSEAPVESYTSEDTVESYTSEDTVPSTTSEDTVPSTTSEATVPSTTSEDTVPSTTSEGTSESYTSTATVESYTIVITVESTTSEATVPSTTSEGTVESATSEDTVPSTTSEGTVESYTSEATVPSYTSEATAGSYTAEATVPSTTSEATVPSTTFEDTLESSTFEDTVESYTFEYTVPSATSVETVPSSTFEDTVESYTTTEGVDSYTVETTVPSTTSEATVDSYTTESTVESYTSTNSSTYSTYSTSTHTVESSTWEVTVFESTVVSTFPSTTFEDTFTGDTAVSTIPSETFEDTFTGDTVVSTIPSTTFEDTFTGDTAVSTIPSETFEDTFTGGTFVSTVPSTTSEATDTFTESSQTTLTFESSTYVNTIYEDTTIITVPSTTSEATVTYTYSFTSEETVTYTATTSTLTNTENCTF